jgi:hypothetical protein
MIKREAKERGTGARRDGRRSGRWSSIETRRRVLGEGNILVVGGGGGNHVQFMANSVDVFEVADHGLEGFAGHPSLGNEEPGGVVLASRGLVEGDRVGVETGISWILGDTALEDAQLAPQHEDPLGRVVVLVGTLRTGSGGESAGSSRLGAGGHLGRGEGGGQDGGAVVRTLVECKLHVGKEQCRWKKGEMRGMSVLMIKKQHCCR